MNVSHWLRERKLKSEKNKFEHYFRYIKKLSKTAAAAVLITLSNDMAIAAERNGLEVGNRVSSKVLKENPLPDDEKLVVLRRSAINYNFHNYQVLHNALNVLERISNQKEISRSDEIIFKDRKKDADKMLNSIEEVISMIRKGDSGRFEQLEEQVKLMEDELNKYRRKVHNFTSTFDSKLKK